MWTVPTAVDDHSRLARSRLLTAERKRRVSGAGVVVGRGGEAA
jgi:hypothetical protein